ncbi:MAG: DUF2807 domain-containing protein [Ferruginibacter sp.]
MTKQILSALVLLGTVTGTVSAEKQNNAATTSKMVTVQQHSKKLKVEGNVDVVLYENNSSTISIFGNESNINNTVVTECDGTLVISNKAGGEKTLVYVPVKNLGAIEAAGNAKITSGTVLNSKEITLVANGDCKINITTSGKIDVINGEETETVVETSNYKFQPDSKS